MREHAVEALRDRLGASQVVGHAVRAEAAEQHVEAVAVAVVAPAHGSRVVGERGGVVIAIAALDHEHAVEQQLDADMARRAARTAGATGACEAIVEIAHQLENGRHVVKRRVGRVVVRDPARDRGVGRLGEPRAAHRREVGQHRAEQRRGLARSVARDRGMPEEVHDPC